VLRKGIAITPVKFGISFNVAHFNQAGRLMTHAPSTYRMPTVNDCPTEFNVRLFENCNAQRVRRTQWTRCAPDSPAPEDVVRQDAPLKTFRVVAKRREQPGMQNRPIHRRSASYPTKRSIERSLALALHPSTEATSHKMPGD
jgi:hypothetical protein